MNEIKRSFYRVKEDIFFLGNEIEKLRLSIQEMSSQISKLDLEISRIKIKIIDFNSKNTENLVKTTPTHNNNLSTHNNIQTQDLLFKALKSQILAVSKGNGGVPTDRQTNQQTDNHLENKEFIQNLAWRKEIEVPKRELAEEKVVVKEKEDDFDKAIRVLNSLDNIKKDIRNKFKRLTEQEFNVFSTLYSLEERGLLVDYKLLAEKLSLTESSIRDYVGKLINKGIPIIKEKINNKQIILHISKDLKEITPLETISKLRDI